MRRQTICLAIDLWLVCICLPPGHMQKTQTAPIPPPYLPAKFCLGIGNPFGTVFTVQLEGDALRYGVDRGGPRSYKTIRPTPEAWKQFWKALDHAKVWKWRADYGGSTMRTDPIGWDLQIEQSGNRGKKIISRGSECFPGDRDLAKPEPGGPYGGPRSHRFLEYTSAVQQLLGGEQFR